MTIARKLKKLYDVREAIRAQLELDEFTLMEDYVEAATGFPMTEYIPNPDASPLMNKLGKILHIKNEIKTALGIGDNVPFEEYYLHIDIADKDPVVVFDFVRNKYTTDGTDIDFSDVGTFIRPSPATMWVGDTLVTLPENTPRINDSGLMLEVEMTNLIPNNTLYDSPNSGRTRSEAVLDERIGTITKLISNVDLETNYMSNTKIDSEIGVGRLTSHIVVSHPDNVRYLVHREVSIAYGGLGYHIDTSTREITNIMGNTIPTVTEFDRGPDFYEVFLHGVTAVSSFRHVLGFGENRSGAVGVFALQDDVVHIAYPMAIQTDEKTSSIIITNGSPATRAADLFEVTVPDGQTVLGDWDDSVTYTLEDGVAVFSGHGNVRKVIIADPDYDENLAMYPNLIITAQNINRLVNSRLFNNIGDSE